MIRFTRQQVETLRVALAEKLFLQSWAEIDQMLRQLLAQTRLSRLVLIPVAQAVHPEKRIPKHFGKRLRIARQAHPEFAGSPTYLARKLDVSVALIEDWEAGRSYPTIEHLITILELLEVGSGEPPGLLGRRRDSGCVGSYACAVRYRIVSHAPILRSLGYPSGDPMVSLVSRAACGRALRVF